MTKVNARHKKLYDLLVNYQAGESIRQADIMTAMSWTVATLRTYESKNMLAPFLIRSDGSTFKALRDGAEVTLKDIAAAFSQVKPRAFVPVVGMVLAGEHAQYTLSGYVGAGAVGNVWRVDSNARDASGPLAAKIMLPRLDLLDTDKIGNVEERFQRESEYGMRLSHPALVRYLDRGTHDEHPFLVMELARRSLGHTLRTHGKLSLAETIPVITACVDALEYLHSKDLVHRDVKPDNILEVERGFVLGDLGIVRWSDLSRSFTSAGTLTRSSMQLGSWFYMAPEQQRAPHEAVPASDIYALGVSWYELLTNSTPSPADIGAQAYEPPTSVEAVNRIIGEMLRHAPGNRASIDAVRGVLRASEHQWAR